VAKTKASPLTIKEGADYRMKVKFRVQHDIVTGLKYLQVVKRAGVTIDKTDEMIGSYGPQAEPYTKAFQPEQAPSGMMARGHYSAKSRFMDDDKNLYLEWEWSFDIKKVRSAERERASVWAHTEAATWAHTIAARTCTVDNSRETHAHVYMHAHLYVHVCVCVCMCLSLSLSVCVCLSLSVWWGHVSWQEWN
jgi:hypothetical protein